MPNIKYVIESDPQAAVKALARFVQLHLDTDHALTTEEIHKLAG